MIEAVVFQDVAVGSFADCGIVLVDLSRKWIGYGWARGAGAVSRIGIRCMEQMCSTDRFDHLVSSDFHFAVSELAHEIQELAVLELVGLVVLNLA